MSAWLSQTYLNRFKGCVTMPPSGQTPPVPESGGLLRTGYKCMFVQQFETTSRLLRVRGQGTPCFIISQV